MSAKTPKHSPSDESHDLDSVELLDSELSGSRKFFLFLFVLVVVAGLTWVILQYAVFAPNEAAEQERQKEQERIEKIAAEQEQDRLLKAKQVEERKAEQARLKKLEKERLAKIAEQNRLQRLKRIKQNSLACIVAIEEKKWKLAEQFLGELQDDRYDLVEVSKLQTRLEYGKVEERKALLKVDKLLDRAKLLDTGKYSEPAIKLLDEALLIYPHHAESSALRKKIDGYTSEYRIPEEFKSIAEVLPKLRAGDTLLLAKGTYQSPAIFNLPIQIKGAGKEHTFLECDTTKSSALVFQGDPVKGKSYSLSGVTVRGTTYQDFNIDRYPLVLVKADVSIDNSLIEMSSGHGIAVIAGTLHLTNSEITANAWDGVSIKGLGAVAHIKKCKIHTNYDHGVDFWENATGSITECEIYEHSGSGIVVMGQKAHAKIEQVRSYKNEQCGIVIMDNGSAQLARVVTAKNGMSGLVVQGKGAKAELGMVISNNNKEAGYYIDPASAVKGYENTTSEGNAKGNLVRKALEFSIKRNAE